ncbi:hypothetical protein LJ737_25195 [Hymenobacter sp. 15J16-1T3B]|uniref:hypothetical protein n=1 Tax=Hymenobacter sp. 15J16-1T3B TaxID=2886941 RepID=UPI001D10CF9B|nr:hypothetical protein [Hymenobacter sp. 15J16-1T3B]MCC3160558.1 hypothetical protein [Hymenobacter sp. 15J16-1T3B]
MAFSAHHRASLGGAAAPVVVAGAAQARSLAFPHDATSIVHVFRRANGATWTRIAVNAASPFLDEDAFRPGTLVEYCVEQHTVQGHCLWRSAVAGLQVE